MTGPGAIVTVSAAAGCPPPAGATNPVAEIELVRDVGVLTSVQPPASVDRRGGWRGRLRVPLLAPGTYFVEVTCLTDPARPPYAFYLPSALQVTGAAPSLEPVTAGPSVPTPFTVTPTASPSPS